MSLRITRPAFVNAMVSRGYEADEKSGLKLLKAGYEKLCLYAVPCGVLFPRKRFNFNVSLD